MFLQAFNYQRDTVEFYKTAFIATAAAAAVNPKNLEAANDMREELRKLMFPEEKHNKQSQQEMAANAAKAFSYMRSGALSFEATRLDVDPGSESTQLDQS